MAHDENATPEFDDIKEGHNKPPLGWTLFYVGLIVWLIYYCISFTPEISGWSFYQTFQAPAKPAVTAPAPSAGTAAAVAIAIPRGDHGIAEEGEHLYEANCMACHGKEMEGGIGPNLKGALKYGEGDAELYASVSDGRPGGMPAFAQQLGKERILKILAHLLDERGEKK